MGRQPTAAITIKWPDRGSVVIYIGRALDCPEQIEVRRNRSGADPFLVYLRPAVAPIGYKVLQVDGAARKISIGRDRATELGLVPGTYEGAIVGNDIVFSLR